MCLPRSASRIIPSIRPLNFAMTNISRQLAMYSPSHVTIAGREATRVLSTLPSKLDASQLRNEFFSYRCRYCGRPLLYERQLLRTIAKPRLYSSCASYVSLLLSFSIELHPAMQFVQDLRRVYVCLLSPSEANASRSRDIASS